MKTTMNTLQQLEELGQSIWYDNIQRNMLGSHGELARMIREDGLMGVTSNPTIFEKAIGGSSDYDAALRQLLQQGGKQSSRELFFTLAIEDIQQAADLLLPVYQRTNGRDGYVSLEVSPDLAYNTEKTIAEAKELAHRVNRPNLMIKVPSTREGVPAVEALTAAGINVNATLLFSVERYTEIAQAYIRGLRQRQQQRLPLEHIASVASFFVSRVDTLIDKLLDEKLAAGGNPKLKKLKGQIAIANAKVAYRVYQRLFGEEFAALANSGAHPQRLLWGSTGTKNQEYSDVLYIDKLIGRETVNTVPPATYKAFLDHGQPSPTLIQGILEAPALLAQLAEAGINLNAATQQLEDEGVKSFDHSFQTLLAAIEGKVLSLAA
jgi:transaldolase